MYVYMHIYARIRSAKRSHVLSLSSPRSLSLPLFLSFTHTHMHTHQTGKEHNETRQKLHEIVKSWTVTRFPAPEIMQLSEGGSMARWLVCRLDPASKDAPAGASCGKFEI